MRSFPEIHEEARSLPGYDGEAFAAMVAVSPLTPKSERSELYRSLAVRNTELAEGLVNEAQARLAAASDSLVIQALSASARIRLLAAEHCRNLAICFAPVAQ